MHYRQEIGVSCVLAICLTFGSEALAQPRDNFGYYTSKEEGWYFYKDPRARKQSLEEPPPPPAPEPRPPQAPPEPEKRPFSVPWLRKKVEILRDNAIEKPSDENMRAFLYAQRLMLDMSDAFATAGQRVTQADPYLNEEFRVPSATFARRGMLFTVEKAKGEILKSLSSRGGLFFFFDSTCAFCDAQYQTMQEVQRETKIPVKAISLDGRPLRGMGRSEFVVDKDRAVFRSLDLKVAPAVVLAVPGTNKEPAQYLVVAHGAMAADGLKDKIALAAMERQLVPKELTDIATLQQRGILKPDDVAQIKAGMQDTDDPQELVKLMTQAIQGRLK
ncbi:conjugal transfer protein TraF [Cupriavidus malaysiensis]|uniref:Conjugal transfer protein TraF n=1 Tax=Cupriavidus malaysiensis TaxID=367825 RepID=A0ABM6FGX5_9BURK|nr:conjugal transfer protein TraF [Cupriavidus malaysiensis]AOZ11210.1 hypothetical protein BKK80_35240 [Cupriavidus malaysiensis]